jgi:hypothetical protein
MDEAGRVGLFDLGGPTSYTGWSAVSVVCSATRLNLLPPRSMVGLATLTRSIGVRIPGGQPKHLKPELPRTSCFTATYTKITCERVRRRPSAARLFCGEKCGVG